MLYIRPKNLIQIIFFNFAESPSGWNYINVIVNVVVRWSDAYHCHWIVMCHGKFFSIMTYSVNYFTFALHF